MAMFEKGATRAGSDQAAGQSEGLFATTYAQAILGPGGDNCVVSGCESRAAAVESCVRLAIRTGMVPPRWWQFWWPRWSEDCWREYERQVQS